MKLDVIGRGFNLSGGLLGRCLHSSFVLSVELGGWEGCGGRGFLGRGVYLFLTFYSFFFLALGANKLIIFEVRNGRLN